MSLKSRIYRIALGFCLILSMSLLTFADTIRLKDGSIIKGKIVSFGEGKFTILIGEGTRQRQMNFFADEVESIEFEAIPNQPTNLKTSLPTYANTSAKTDNPKTNETQPTSSKTVVITDNTKQPNTNPTNTNSTQPKTDTDKTVPNQTNPNITSQTPQVITTTPTNTSNPNTTVKTDVTPKPIMLNVKVLADNTSNGWTNSGWVVKKGQKIRINGKGQINLGNGRFASSGGVTSLPDKDKLMQTEATGGLIAVIGDDNNEFIFIGSSREFVAARDGALFLGINEGNLDDNSGSLDVTIEITPN
jgi:hypothetical protein